MHADSDAVGDAVGDGVIQLVTELVIQLVMQLVLMMDHWWEKELEQLIHLDLMVMKDSAYLDYCML